MIKSRVKNVTGNAKQPIKRGERVGGKVADNQRPVKNKK